MLFTVVEPQQPQFEEISEAKSILMPPIQQLNNSVAQKDKKLPKILTKLFKRLLRKLQNNKSLFENVQKTWINNTTMK